MKHKCPYYQGVCGIDERYICFTSGANCDIREKYEKQLNEDIKKQYKPTGVNINDLLKETKCVHTKKKMVKRHTALAIVRAAYGKKSLKR